MRAFKGKTAVITGAANGFGLEFAKECARREMKVVMNDIDGADLQKAAEAVRAFGAEVATLEADVSLYEEMQKLVKLAVDSFGTLDLMFNNAGVYYIGRVWEMPVRDLRWMLDANVLSVFYGMREAIPVMQKQGTPCHIVNVASVAGLTTARTMSAYNASKAAVVAASEAALMDLKALPDNNIGLSVFCPGYVKTDLDNCERHRPQRYAQDGDPYYESAAYKKNTTMLHKFIQGGEKIDVVVPSVFRGIEEDSFYISTDATDEMFTPVMQKRFGNIVSKTNPA
ncbi:SDR family NAD(P)-dependent oxidoreductase [Ruminococcaceae bacterium OttesenSCG-928-D13]|nr:SDR family NAD(P)-dependent oxidoreductase [Ruminococcaceae bacterium OttesenSCG-928-D13]